MQNKKLLFYPLMSLSVILVWACSAGSSGRVASQNSLVTINTYDYNPGNKTAVNITVGGSAPIQAEIDSGSDLTVINESALNGANIRMTTESISISYGGGQNIVSGFLGYAGVTFTTSTGDSISSSSNTPILVVTQGSVNEGGGNNAILGMRMNNQTSVKLYLPYPYNQMMVLNRSQNQLIFGQLTQAQVNTFANISMIPTKCINYAIPATATNQCWDTESSSVTYTYSQTGKGESTVNYHTIFDSGEALGNFYLSPAPSWMNYTLNGLILNTITAAVNTDKGAVPLLLPTILQYQNSSGNMVNPGNAYFNSYQVLFDQADGITGFLDPARPL